MRISNSRIHKFFFPSFTYKTDSSAIHLTFDDGPHPAATRTVLQILKSRNAKATFFLLGRNIENLPAITRQIVDEGHSVGNHTFDHSLLVMRSRGFVIDQLQRTEDALLKATGKKTRLFRPPYGFIDYRSATIVRQRGYDVVMWTKDPGDFRQIENQTVVRQATEGIAAGSILLLHDNMKTSNKVSEILKGILDNLSARGFTFSALPS
ncbi:MAG: polysaccharide deacetylase [Bacteroidetes bacterium]|nr:polysaccharide deacetylase [Bacteroidota bacterium]